MRGSNDINLMMMASLMPTPDGILLLAALDRVPGRPPEPCEPERGVTGFAMLVSVATLVIGLLALLPAPI